MQFDENVKFLAENLDSDLSAVKAGILDNIMQGVFVLNDGNKIVYANNFLLKRIKKTLPEIVGHSIFEMQGGVDGGELKKALHTLREQKKMLSMKNVQHMEINNEVIYIDFFLYPIVNNEEKVIGCVLVAESANVGRKYFRESYKLNVFMRYVVNAMTEGATVIDGNGRLLFANDHFYFMLGYTPNELIGQHWSYWCYEGDLENQKGKLSVKNCVKKRNNVYEYRLRLKKKNGDLLPVILSVSKNSDKDFDVKSVGAIVDISENVRLKSEYQEMNNLNRKILETISTAIITFDKDLTIKYINNQVEVLFGKRLDEVLGQRIATALPRLEILEEWSSWVMRSMKPYKIDRYKMENVFDDRVFFLNVRIQPILDENNHINGVVCVFDDVSASAQLEEQIEQSFRKLEMTHNKLSTLMRRQKDFLADISHELRTPLTVMSGNIEIALRDESSTREELIEVLGIVESELIKMTSMVKDITTLTKMEDGKMELQITEVDFSEVMHDMFRRLENFDKGLKNVYFEMDEKLQVKVDVEKIKSMLWNLIENGLKYTNDDGMVLVRIFQDEKAKADLIIEVEDNGIGIPQEDVEYIFDRFYRVDKARSREKGGSGLGLAIVKSIIDAHKGTILVESKLDEGTVFRVTLPVIVE